MSDAQDKSGQDEQGGQVSEVSALRDPNEPISPEDAVAGYPESESGHPDEGPTGPNAGSKRTRTTADRQWDDD